MQSFDSQAIDERFAQRRSAAAACRRGVLLINLGTPDEPTVPAVRRYLREFLADPAVIRLPRGLGLLNKPLGRWIAFFRARKSARMYSKIWNEDGAPLRAIAEQQVRKLQDVMPHGYHVLGAMRYGEPSIRRALRRAEQVGVEELVVVPMYPQYSGPTTGTALKAVYDELAKSAPLIHVTTRPCWYDDHGYILAQTRLIKEYAQAHGLTPDNTFLLFSTHGMPVSYIREGDPYPEQVACTVALVGEQLCWPNDRMSLAYQSRFGPVPWLQPFTDEVLADLVKSGEKRVLVCPICFTTDCLETLEELDLRFRAILEAGGAEMYLTPALNTYSPFIASLKEIVLRGPRPMRKPARAVRTFLTTPASQAPGQLAESLNGLVMVGLSLPPRVPSPAHSQRAAAELGDLRSAKCSACDVPELVRDAVRRGGLSEGILWNTCHRFEFFGLIPGMLDRSKMDATVGRIRASLFDDRNVEARNINVFRGRQAWSYLARTAVGLNSALPGERDVFEQFKSAIRLADRAGSIGPVFRKLLVEVTDLERRIRKETAWGDYEPEYTQVALERVVRASSLNLSRCNIVVVGGSTTSASVLRGLTDQFNVPSRNLTLLYRGHKRGGQLKLLRKAIGNGTRTRVQTYAQASVKKAIANADVVIFGVDHSEPLIDGSSLRILRDWRHRPLTVIDFNTFGSVEVPEPIEGITIFPFSFLDAEVSDYAEAMCDTDSFRRAYVAAQRWIDEELGLAEEHREGPGRLRNAQTPIDVVASRSSCGPAGPERSDTKDVVMGEL